jgi:hypothetical protein
MGSSTVPASGGGLAVARFRAAPNQPFNIPAGLTLQHTVTSTTTYTAGQLPAQVWAVVVGAGGSGGISSATQQSGGGGGGGIKIGWVDVPSAGITATIGAGGATRTGNNSGLRGGSTVFGSVLVHGGGGGCNNGSAVFDTGTAIPFGEGLPGYGGTGTTGAFPATNSIAIFINGAPYGSNPGAFSISSAGSGLALQSNSIQGMSNFVGGGAGGMNGSGSLPATGGSGFTGGGAGNGSTGGSSSRDGGISNTFTGGTGSGGNGGGGAGFLAVGTNASSVGGAGGSGGGGGGNGAVGTTSGAGGAGCVLIYF